MSWFAKLLPAKIRTTVANKKTGIPEGLWTKCEVCSAILYRVELERNLCVCPKCDHHHRLRARKRQEFLLDKGSWTELAKDVIPVDRLKFRDSKKYKDRIALAQKSIEENEALIVYEGMIEQLPVVVAVFEFAFMGGSMGAAVGERFVQAIHHCIQKKLPFICVTASGGARMQEGMFSLMQMAKTSAALAALSQKRIPFISVLTDPTMGGVSASLAMLGDIIIAEPNALIGFAGPRVIEQTVRQVLPEGFQHSEFLLEHGAIDMVLHRCELRGRIAELLRKLLRI